MARLPTTEPNPEEIFAFFSEQMWHPSLIRWVGWPATLAVLVGAGVCLFVLKTFMVGGFLLGVALALAGFLVHATVEQQRHWKVYIDASRRQIERDYQRMDSTLCLVQQVWLGLCDRLLLLKSNNQLHFKGYFMRPRKARKWAEAAVTGYVYVDSAKIVSGVLPLSRIDGFRFCRSFRARYAILALAGFGVGAALLLPHLAVGTWPGAAAIGSLALLAAGLVGAVLFLVHRFPEVRLRIGQYDLRIVANRPDEETVRRFLHRLGYSDIPSPRRLPSRK